MSKQDLREESATGAAIGVVKTMDPHNLVAGLDADIRWKIRILLLVIALLGYGRARVVSGRRTLGQQRELYGRGRSAAECKARGVPVTFSVPRAQVVTWVHPEDSKHLCGQAVDIDFGMYTRGSLAEVGSAAEQLGLVWGGRWEVRDFGHFEG